MVDPNMEYENVDDIMQHFYHKHFAERYKNKKQI